MTYVPSPLLVSSKCQILPTLKEVGPHKSRTPYMYIFDYKEIDLTELAYELLGLASQKPVGQGTLAGWQLRKDRVDGAFWGRISSLGNFIFCS